MRVAPLRWRSMTAAAFAVLVLLVQLIVAAHVHPDLLVKSISDSRHAAVGEAACPVCLFQAHTKAGTANAPILVRPLPPHRFFAVAMFSRLLVIPKPQLFGRAPPASI